MTLANGRTILAIPGPSVMPDAVLRAMDRAAPHIYTGELVEVTRSVVADLKAVAQTEHDVAMYIANGHGAWEAALANTLSRGDRVLVLVTGRFARGWATMAEAMGIECDLLDFGRRGPVDPARVEEALRADGAGAYAAVLMVQVDTSTSVRNDVAGVRAALDAAGHPALLMVDAIACLACDDLPMDAWGVDVVVAGCQKGLMTPPGMAYVFFNDRAEAARKTADLVTHYWDWRPRAAPGEYYQHFDGTAPTHHLYGQRAALDILMDEGLPVVFARHARLAGAVWAAVEAWGGALALNIPDAAHRSHAVTTIRMPLGEAERLRDWTEAHGGVTLGLGIGMLEPGETAEASHFRIGHMGHVNAHMVLGTLGVIEAGLGALGIDHAPGGVAAAAAACG
ncbi:MAG: pyridoxal-phosphate-dependent aminotransferase family protein [Shimia sp.]